MTFQFECPQGHLLEGEPSQGGQQCNCPICGVLFIIPHPVDSPTSAPDTPAFPRVRPNRLQTSWETSPSSEPKLLHIPCPNGHELETPPDMINQEAMCPHCGAQFRLRAEDSVENRAKIQKELERKERKAAKIWFNWAIVTAVLVILGLLLLIFGSSG